MTYQFASCPIVGTVRSESLLEKITRRLRDGLDWLIKTLNQKGNP